MNLLTKFILEVWTMTAQLAPWLLVGFALAGLISLGLKRSLVTRVLGRPGLGSIVKATLVGVPLPICSCGVIPVAAAIREKGAGKGATAAFLASTPETGVDSAIATWGMLGPVMAIVRVALAFVSGILAGLFVSFATRKDPDETAPSTEADACSCSEPKQGLRDALKYAFLSMPMEMAKSLIVGILLAAAVASLIPADFFASIGVHGLLAYVIVSIVAVPLYVCSTGSIPLALAMIQAGFSPGAALVFLVTGPATNATTLTTMKRYLGGRGILAYLLAIVVTAWGAGAVLDAGFGRASILGQMPHEMGSVSVTGAICAVILAVLVFRGLIVKMLPSGAASSCCSSGSESAAGAEHSCCCGSGSNKGPAPAAEPHSCCCHSKKETPATETHHCNCGSDKEKAAHNTPASEPHSCCCSSKSGAKKEPSGSVPNDGEKDPERPSGGCCCGH